MENSEWVIHKGIFDPNELYIWHTTCKSTWYRRDHPYAVVGGTSEIWNICSNCKKEPPKYIWFQYMLLGGKFYKIV